MDSDLDLKYRQIITAWRKTAEELAEALGNWHTHAEYHPDCHACDALEAWRLMREVQQFDGAENG